ncbi:MAG: type I-E CRISPR-associated endoribonuclease Cas2 [Phycisphaerae bacterium]|nr:type I-E CRISPR-associated endoribonuclease Cas2 [Phycisphaerae bacterium]
MVVLIVERVPASLRGLLSRWMIEPRTGVFVGRLSALVRDKVWDKTTSLLRGGGATMIFKNPTEQGFAIRTHGKTDRTPVDFEGLVLIRSPSVS